MNGEVQRLYDTKPKSQPSIKLKEIVPEGWTKQNGPLVQYPLCKDIKSIRDLPSWDSFVQYVGDSLLDVNGKLTVNGQPHYFCKDLQLFSGGYLYDVWPNMHEAWAFFVSDQLRSWCPQVEIIEYWNPGIYGIKHKDVIRDYKNDSDFVVDFVYICFMVMSNMEIPAWVDNKIDLTFVSPLFVLRKNNNIIGYNKDRNKLIDMMDEI